MEALRQAILLAAGCFEELASCVAAYSGSRVAQMQIMQPCSASAKLRKVTKWALASGH